MRPIGVVGRAGGGPVDREFDDGFAEFVTRWSPALLRVAFLLTSDRGEAEDLLQTALLKPARGAARGRCRGRGGRRRHPGRCLAHDPLGRPPARRATGPAEPSPSVTLPAPTTP